MITPEALFVRNIMLYGPEGFARLQRCFVAVVGLGGVGSYAAEALVRAGIGKLRVIDCDVIKASDVNRQLLALSSNPNRPKVEVAAERFLAINPSLHLDARFVFFHADNAAELMTSDLDFVIDAIDSLHPKGELIRYCTERNIPIISALGAAGRADPFRIRVDRLDDTTICPLARTLRRHLRTHRISTDVPVVYSTEPMIEASLGGPAPELEASGTYLRGRRRRTLPSLPTIPALFGLIAASQVLNELLKNAASRSDSAALEKNEGQP